MHLITFPETYETPSKIRLFHPRPNYSKFSFNARVASAGIAKRNQLKGGGVPSPEGLQYRSERFPNGVFFPWVHCWGGLSGLGVSRCRRSRCRSRWARGHDPPRLIRCKIRQNHTSLQAAKHPPRYSPCKSRRTYMLLHGTKHPPQESMKQAVAACHGAPATTKSL